MESSRRYSSDSVVGMACIPEIFACGSKLICLTHSAWVGETTSLMEFANLSVSDFSGFLFSFIRCSDRVNTCLGSVVAGGNAAYC